MSKIRDRTRKLARLKNKRANLNKRIEGETMNRETDAIDWLIMIVGVIGWIALALCLLNK